MDRYVILLPLHDNAGLPFTEVQMQEAIDALYILANGYSIEGRVQGAYRMKSGKKQEDELLRVSVLIAPECADELRALVREFCRRWGQECIWLEKSNSVVELVEPEAP